MDSSLYQVLEELTGYEVYQCIPLLRRDDSGGITVIFDDRIGYDVYVNRTAREIIDLLDGDRTLNEVVDTMSAQYPSVPREQLYLDALRIVRDLGGRRLIRHFRKRAG